MPIRQLKLSIFVAVLSLGCGEASNDVYVGDGTGTASGTSSSIDQQTDGEVESDSLEVDQQVDSSQSSSEKRTAGEMHDFLWKPEAESDYNKGSMVIHVSPCNATVYVKGQALHDYGPANGRCNTSRAFNPGCDYGNNIKVEVIDNKTKRPYTHNGVPYVIVPRGCDRYEFK